MSGNSTVASPLHIVPHNGVKVSTMFNSRQRLFQKDSLLRAVVVGIVPIPNCPTGLLLLL